MLDARGALSFWTVELERCSIDDQARCCLSVDEDEDEIKTVTYSLE